MFVRFKLINIRNIRKPFTTRFGTKSEFKLGTLIGRRTNISNVRMPLSTIGYFLP